MKGPRVDKLADMLVNYSIDVQPEQKIMIHGELGGEPLMAAVMRKCLQEGARRRLGRGSKLAPTK